MAAEVSYQVTISVNSDGRIVEGSRTYTGEQVQRTRVAVADVASDNVFVVPIVVSRLKAIIVVSDQDLLVEVNDPVSAAGDLTLILKAGLPYIWTEDFYFENLFDTDVVNFYVTNASGSEAIFEVLPLYDPTP